MHGPRGGPVRSHDGRGALHELEATRARGSRQAMYAAAMLELDHVIQFLPGPATELAGFEVAPGRVHTGQGTRNARVVFEASYLELVWIEHPDEVVARGLDFVARCARPAACPFGCVLRGQMPEALRPHFRPYELPDAPGLVLQLLEPQPEDAPFVAVFEAATAGRITPGAHPNGAARITRVTFAAPVRPAVADALGVPELRFTVGAPRLAIELGDVALELT